MTIALPWVIFWMCLSAFVGMLIGIALNWHAAQESSRQFQEADRRWNLGTTALQEAVEKNKEVVQNMEKLEQARETLKRLVETYPPQVVASLFAEVGKKQ